MGIGTLNESPLHAALKALFVDEGGQAEVPVANYVADALCDGVIYEIQTGSFSGLTKKLRALADLGPVVLVHPIACQKTIVKLPLDPDDVASRRKSPKKGRLSHIVSELVYIPTLLNHPNFELEVVMTQEEEVRAFDPKKVRRRGGWRVIERRLIAVEGRRRFATTEDLYSLMEGELVDRGFQRHDLLFAHPETEEQGSGLES